ncbi:MAG: hypothetical protein NTX79_01205 [Candidatus Micrarchaeota archaeon]|nr:hypothetical protein [Candidatus Micrarchaeota archaeon]
MDRHANIIAFAVVMMLIPTAFSAATYDDCLNAINAMSPPIKDAQSRLDFLNSKLNDANTYGISSPTHSSAATSAQNLLTKAKASEHSASADFAGAKYDACVYDASSAKNYASQAGTIADSSAILVFSMLAAQLNYEITTDQTSLQLADGTSTTVLIRLASRDNRKLDCGYQTSQTPLQELGIIPPSGTQSFPATVQAPPSGNGTMQFLVYVSCSVGSYMSGEKQAAIEVQYRPDPVLLAINQANKSIASAQTWIDMASGVIGNASDIGMDTRNEIAAVATSKGLLLNARDYLQSAQTYISSSDEGAKADADKANDYATQAGEKARTAYESLNSNIETCKEAYRQIVSAQADISDADAIYTKLASVVRSLPGEMNAGAAAQDVEAQRQKLDRAKNENSQAKTQLSAGYCGQSVNSGISARNDAADASNQLSRVAERMKDTIVSALDAASLQTESKIGAARNATAAAGGTFLADSAKTIYAQQQLTDAQTALLGAQGAVESAKQATSLSDFLDKTADAFGKLQNVDIVADSSLQSADSARNDAYVKYGVAIAAVIVAVGVGFLFWNRKQGRERKGKPSPKVERLLTAREYGEAAERYALKHEYQKAAEYYAKAGKYEKAKEMYKKSIKKR